MKTVMKGTARLQWRTAGQDSFPESGQQISFDVAGADWQELGVPLPIEGQLVHMRLFLSDAKRPTEIDWIEIVSKAQNEKDGKQVWADRNITMRLQTNVSKVDWLAHEVVLGDDSRIGYRKLIWAGAARRSPPW